MSEQLYYFAGSRLTRRLAGWGRFFSIGLIAAFVALASVSTSQAQIVIQQAPDAHYIAWEAHDGTFTNGDDSTGWILVDNDPNSETPQVVMPHEQLGEATVALPEETNASRGNAVLDQVGGGDQDWINYQLQFSQPGTYFLYAHYSMFDRTDTSGYGNEDSIYFPREFGVVPTGPRGDNNYWASTPGNPELSELAEAPNFDNGLMEGNYHWWRVTAQDPAVDGEGSDIKVVGDGDVGQVLEFGMAAREAGTSIDKLIMSTRDDLTVEELDAIPTFDISIPPGAIPGDFNFDGTVDAADFAILAENFNVTFAIAESYEKGDLSRDGLVGLEDFRQTREIFLAPPPAEGAGAAAVPEPAGLTMVLSAAVLGLLARRRRRG